VSGEEPPRRRPYTTWFVLLVAAVIGLAFLGQWLQRKYG
jgi:hypothetical protein